MSPPGSVWSRSGSKGFARTLPNGQASPIGMARSCGRGSGPCPSRFAKEVDLVIGPPEFAMPVWCSRCGGALPGQRRCSPSWSPTSILTHLGPEMTSLSLEGTYQPPLGPLGRVVDRVALRKFAEATVKDWVDRVAEAVAASPQAHLTGRVIKTSVPDPGWLDTEMSPPRRVTRARRLPKPIPGLAASTSKPIPSSSTRTTQRSPTCMIEMSTFWADGMTKGVGQGLGDDAKDLGVQFVVAGLLSADAQTHVGRVGGAHPIHQIVEAGGKRRLDPGRLQIEDVGAQRLDGAIETIRLPPRSWLRLGGRSTSWDTPCRPRPTAKRSWITESCRSRAIRCRSSITAILRSRSWRRPVRTAAPAIRLSASISITSWSVNPPFLSVRYRLPKAVSPTATGTPRKLPHRGVVGGKPTVSGCWEISSRRIVLLSRTTVPKTPCPVGRWPISFGFLGGDPLVDELGEDPVLTDDPQGGVGGTGRGPRLGDQPPEDELQVGFPDHAYRGLDQLGVLVE